MPDLSRRSFFGMLAIAPVVAPAAVNEIGRSVAPACHLRLEGLGAELHERLAYYKKIILAEPGDISAPFVKADSIAASVAMGKAPSESSSVQSDATDEFDGRGLA